MWRLGNLRPASTPCLVEYFRRSKTSPTFRPFRVRTYFDAHLPSFANRIDVSGPRVLSLHFGVAIISRPTCLRIDRSCGRSASPRKCGNCQSVDRRGGNHVVGSRRPPLDVVPDPIAYSSGPIIRNSSFGRARVSCLIGSQSLNLLLSRPRRRRFKLFFSYSGIVSTYTAS